MRYLQDKLNLLGLYVGLAGANQWKVMVLKRSIEDFVKLALSRLKLGRSSMVCWRV